MAISSTDSLSFQQLCAVYLEELRTQSQNPHATSDFPRLSLPANKAYFRALAKLGNRLVALHLLDEQTAPVLNQTRHAFEGAGSRTVERAEYSGATQEV